MLHLQTRKNKSNNELQTPIFEAFCSCEKLFMCKNWVYHFGFVFPFPMVPWSPLPFPFCMFFCLYSFFVLILFVVFFVSCCCLFHNCAFSIFSLYFFWCLSFSTCVFCGSLSLGLSLFCLLVVLLFFCCPCPFVCALSFFCAFLSDFCLLRSFTHLYLLLFALCFLSLVSFLFLFALFLFLLPLTFPLHFLLLSSDLVFLVWVLPIHV